MQEPTNQTPNPANPIFTLRHMACAYIWHDSDVLMMKKSSSSNLFANLWVPVGGHFEPDEIANPQNTCLREIQEETGFEKHQIVNLKAKYVTIRRKNNEVRLQHIFFCQSTSRNFINSDEGELHWIPDKDLLSLEMSTTNQSALKHYFSKGQNNDALFIGIVKITNLKPELVWVQLDSLDTVN